MWYIEKSNLKHKETVSRKKCGVMKDEIRLFSGNSGFVRTMYWVQSLDGDFVAEVLVVNTSCLKFHLGLSL